VRRFIAAVDSFCGPAANESPQFQAAAENSRGLARVSSEINPNRRFRPLDGARRPLLNDDVRFFRSFVLYLWSVALSRVPLSLIGSPVDRLDGPVLDVYLLGLHSYEDALRLQRRLVYDVSGSAGQTAALVLCEHYPIISVGRLGSRAHIECDDAELRARRLAVRWVNRGGGCMLHMPGQLAVYPIWPFQPRRLDIRGYLTRLENCLLRVLEGFDIRGDARPDHSGIWTSAGQIASIGVSVSRWVSYFGMTLNVSGVRDQFRILHPDGNGSMRATTMEAVRQRPAPMAKVRELMISCFVEQFQPARYNIFTQHPLLADTGRERFYARSS
jgi:lipoyl(octanoyl) transferase